GRTSRNASVPSPLKKYCGSARRSFCWGGRAPRLPHGLRYAAGSASTSRADRQTARSRVKNWSSAGLSGSPGFRPAARRFAWPGHGRQRLRHARAVAAADDDYHVVVVAELVEVLPPALLRLLVGADQVAALGLVLEAGGGGVDGEAAQEEGEEKDGARPAADG